MRHAFLRCTCCSLQGTLWKEAAFPWKFGLGLCTEFPQWKFRIWTLFFVTFYCKSITCFSILLVYIHCKPKPCKAYREFPVSQFPQGKPAFITWEPCSHCRFPVLITGFSLYFPVLSCKGLQCRGKFLMQSNYKPNSQMEFRYYSQVSRPRSISNLQL